MAGGPVVLRQGRSRWLRWSGCIVTATPGASRAFVAGDAAGCGRRGHPVRRRRRRRLQTHPTTAANRTMTRHCEPSS